MINYAIHQIALKSGWYSWWFDEFEFIRPTDEIEIKLWINSLHELDQISFEQFIEFWLNLGYKDQILWYYLCCILRFDSTVTDKNFPTELIRTGFIKFKVQNRGSGMIDSFEYYPFVVTEYLLSTPQDISFPPTNCWCIDDWPAKSYKHNHSKFLDYLQNKEGYSNEYLLINANYYEYKNFGLEGFEIIQAIIHFLEDNQYMSKQMLKINHWRPI